MKWFRRFIIFFIWLITCLLFEIISIFHLKKRWILFFPPSFWYAFHVNLFLFSKFVCWLAKSHEWQCLFAFEGRRKNMKTARIDWWKREVADQAKHAHMVPESKIKHSMCGWHTNKVIHVTKNEHIYIHPHAFRAYMQACNCAGLSQCTSPSWTHLLFLLSLLVLSSIKRVYAAHVQWLSILLISHSCFFVFHFVWFFTLCSRFACDSRNKRSNIVHFILCQLY